MGVDARNILLIQVMLVLDAGAIMITMAALIQQPTVATTIRPFTTTTSASGFHFIKS